MAVLASLVLTQDAGVSDVQERVSLTVQKDGARVLKVRDSAKAKWRPFMQVSADYTLEVIDLTDDKEALVLLHNLYAIATPGTWNGSPDADPCAPVMTPDGAALADAGTTTTDDAGTTTMDPPAGCGCRSTDGAPAWPMFALLGAWIVRRRR